MFSNWRRPLDVSDYDVLCLIGEGSFGRVYKAKVRATGEVVAYKVIAKVGRSISELLSLRRECEIQQHLHHPNIIRMIDSFETEKEIVVVTEFVERGLRDLLQNEKTLTETEAQKIICDLVSALYYLHSHRILHRDLKPENILLGENDSAKICDFGFARDIGTSSNVLTSIKGTPLYMAPEVIGEIPYNHNADLWSLGCISYQLIAGHPPFMTCSIFDLVRMIRKDSIVWPSNLSAEFLSFLQGLLQKDPSRRLSWPQLLHHPFVQNKVRIVENNAAALAVMSYTSPDIVARANYGDRNRYSPVVSPPSMTVQDRRDIDSPFHMENRNHLYNDNGFLDASNVCPCCVGSKYDTGLTRNPFYDTFNFYAESHPSTEPETDLYHLQQKLRNVSFGSSSSEDTAVSDESSEYEDSGNGSEETENEEWLKFIKNNTKDVINGDIESLREKPFLDMITSPLKNSNVCSSVVEATAKLLSLPFVIDIVTASEVDTIRQMYLECNVVPDLLCASKQIMFPAGVTTSIVELTSVQLSCLEYTYLLICNLVYAKDEFLQQFHKCVVTFQLASVLRILLSLEQHDTRIITDVMSIFLRLISDLPSSHELVDKVIFGTTINKEPIDFHPLLTSTNDTLRMKVCVLILLLTKTHRKSLANVWNSKLTKDLCSLKDNAALSVSSIAVAAEIAVKSLDNSI